LAAIVIAVTPGPGAVISMSTGTRHGYRAALVTILGLQFALLAHVAIVAVGLGALLAASETAFTLLKLIGAGYLVWLGLQKWRAPRLPIDGECPESPRNSLFMEGLLVNLSNPKAIVFICALVPQFIDPSKAQLPQYLIIAATLCATDTVVMSTYALAAARLDNWLHRPEYVRLQNRIFGGLFVSAGALLGLSARS
jgi:homoserine/homoserine lactone efflux protein